MYSPVKKLDTPEIFNDFPYVPYDIQSQLMQDVFSVLEQKQIGIFESPTGTGKSLTLTCAALTWLESHEALVRSELKERIEELEQKISKIKLDLNVGDDWLEKQKIYMSNRNDLFELRDLNDLAETYEIELKAIKNRRAEQSKKQSATNRIERKRAPDNSDEEQNDVDDFNIESERETSTLHDDDDDDNNPQPFRYRDVKIFYCSRTHSQLTQIFSELRKTKFKNRVRCIPLASRQQLCINEQVRQLSNVTSMNERCLDMANSKIISSCSQPNCKKPRLPFAAELQKEKCKFQKCAYKGEESIRDLSDVALTELCDIEDLVKKGKVMKACPYYAARQAQPNAQLILLPYQMIFNAEARIQNGIELRGAVIIIDEAHNLVDSITQIHSCEVTMKQLLLAHRQIAAYKLHYSNKLSYKNMLQINKLLYIVKQLSKRLAFAPNNSENDFPQFGCKQQTIMQVQQFIADNDLYTNLNEVLAFCSQTRFAQKLHGFIMRKNNATDHPKKKVPDDSVDNVSPNKSPALNILKRLADEHKQTQSPQVGIKKNVNETYAVLAQRSLTNSTSLNSASSSTGNPQETTQQTNSNPIRPLLTFLEALKNPSEDGRIIITPHLDVSQAFCKYFLLNPNKQFYSITSQARAIIIAGGTMQPTRDLKTQLLQAYPPEHLIEHFYTHVIPKDSVLPLVITRGSIGEQLNFDYTNRGKEIMLRNLSVIIKNLCEVVPGGLVCFVPSYDYLYTFQKYLKDSHMLAILQKFKKIFFDNNTCLKNNVERLLDAYASAIRGTKANASVGSGTSDACNGALLFSVVGGKLSEGLNFADDLGRGVIVVGLPYPNKKSVELTERMNYLDQVSGNKAGQEYYNNLCMKAVNQCIGRSIRHINDYACVYLLDERYANVNIQSKLPSWILGVLQVQKADFGEIKEQTASFFKKHLPK